MSNRFEQRSNNVIGLFLLALGVSILGERLDLFMVASPFGFALGISVAYLGLSSLVRSPGVLSGVVSAFGVLLLTNGLGLTQVAFGSLWSVFWPLMLILLGVLLIGSWGGLGAGQGKSVLNLLGDYRMTPSEASDLTDRTVWSLIGDVRVDLSAYRVAEGVTHLRINSLIGDTVLMVPSDMAVEIFASSLLGNMDVFNQHYDGIMQTATHRSDAYEGHPKRLRIHIQSLLGDVDVRRVA